MRCAQPKTGPAFKVNWDAIQLQNSPYRLGPKALSNVYFKSYRLTLHHNSREIPSGSFEYTPRTPPPGEIHLCRDEEGGGPGEEYQQCRMWYIGEPERTLKARVSKLPCVKWSSPRRNPYLGNQFFTSNVRGEDLVKNINSKYIGEVERALTARVSELPGFRRSSPSVSKYLLWVMRCS